MNRGSVRRPEGLGFPQPDDSYVITIERVRHFDAGRCLPDDAAMLAGLTSSSGIPKRPTPRRAYEFFDRPAPIVAFTKITGEWYLPHPLTDFFPPLSEAADFIESTLAETPAIDIGYGPVLIYPFPRSKVTAPFIPLANERVNVLFSLLRWASSADPAVAADLVAKNRAVYEGVREVGGKRYSIGSVELNFADWVIHYGARWPQVSPAS